MGYNPATDAPAVVFYGAELIRTGVHAGLFRYEGYLMDDWGAFMDSDDCPVCGGMPSRVRVQNPRPKAPPYEQAFTTCHLCLPGVSRRVVIPHPLGTRWS